MFEHWEATKSGDKAEALPLVGELGFKDCAEAAERVASFLFGPIYGLARETIKIISSPGVNTAAFLQSQSKEHAVVLPVLDQAMYGADPTRTLDGTRLSLSYCLKENSSVWIIWIIRGEAKRNTLHYTKYVYERSFLATLFQLLRTTADEGWMGLAPWDQIKKRLFVCTSPVGDGGIDKGPDKLVVDDFLPRRTPERWCRGKDQTDLNEYGFAIVATGAEEHELEYWRYTKSEPCAFSPISAGVDLTMKSAHELLIRSVEQCGSQANHSDSAVRQSSSASRARANASPELAQMKGVGWRIASAEDFIPGADH